MREFEYLDRCEARARGRLRAFAEGAGIEGLARRHPVLTVGLAAATGVLLVRALASTGGSLAGVARLVTRGAGFALPSTVRTIGAVLSEL